MRKIARNELNKLLSWIFVLGLIVIYVLLAYSGLSLQSNLRQQARDAEENTSKQIADYYQGALSMAASMIFQPSTLQYINPELVEGFQQGTDVKKYLDFALNSFRTAYDAEGMAIISEGKVLTYAIKPEGISIDSFPFSGTTMPAEELLSKIGGREGKFLYIAVPLSIPKLEGTVLVGTLIDRTRELNELTSGYDAQITSMWKWHGVAAFVALVLLALFAFVFARLMVNRFINKPVRTLAHISEEIMNGNFEVKIPLDESSDFAPLQKLLRQSLELLEKAMEAEVE